MSNFSSAANNLGAKLDSNPTARLSIPKIINRRKTMEFLNVVNRLEYIRNPPKRHRMVIHGYLLIYYDPLI